MEAGGVRHNYRCISGKQRDGEFNLMTDDWLFAER